LTTGQVVALIHGSGQHAGVWDLLIPELRRRGFDPIAIDLTGDPPDTGAIRLADRVATQLGAATDVIAVAHSASGLLLPAVAGVVPLRRMVFLCALIPTIGKSFVQRFEEEGDAIFFADWIGKEPVNDDEAAVRFIFHDCDRVLLPWALTTRAPFSPDGLYAEVCPVTSWPAVPSSSIVCADDRTIRPDWSRDAARTMLGVEPITLPGGHCPQVSRPRSLAEALVASSESGPSESEPYGCGA
jgi:pimeloyl-ACP methyl ester carboxylesterase